MSNNNLKIRILLVDLDKDFKDFLVLKDFKINLDNNKVAEQVLSVIYLRNLRNFLVDKGEEEGKVDNNQQ
jgi:hypothetical protein